MRLHDALREFRVGLIPYSGYDIALIERSLGDAAGRDFVVTVEYVRDERHEFHIHPGFLLSKRPFEGSGRHPGEKYPDFPHFIGLSSFEAGSKSRSVPSIDYSSCPVSGDLYPSGSECPDCGVVH